jgi:hypothetical protein
MALHQHFFNFLNLTKIMNQLITFVKLPAYTHRRKRIHQIVKEPWIFEKRHLNKIFILYANLIKLIIAITLAHKHDQRHRGRLYYRRINRVCRLSPQTERCKYIASLRSLYTRTAALYLIFTHFFYSFYLVLQILENDFYIYIDLDLYHNSNIYTI